MTFLIMAAQQYDKLHEQMRALRADAIEKGQAATIAAREDSLLGMAKIRNAMVEVNAEDINKACDGRLCDPSEYLKTCVGNTEGRKA